MEKEESKILVHEKILEKAREVCEFQSEKKKFSYNELSRELQYFVSIELQQLDRPLYNRITNNSNSDKGLSSSTIGFSFSNEGKPGDGATKNMRDLLCYYAFKKDWIDTLKLLNSSQEEELLRTKEAKQEYENRKAGKPVDSRTDSELKEFAKRVYIELSTRKAGIPIDKDKDVIEDIYNSWYALFCSIREEMKKLPVAYFSKDAESEPVIEIARKILNDILRPHLTEHQAKYRSWIKSSKQIQGLERLSPQELQKQYPDYINLIKSITVTNMLLINSTREISNYIN